jgi:hypothetical protein
MTLCAMPIILTALYQSRFAVPRACTSSTLVSRLPSFFQLSRTMSSTFQHRDYHIPITLPPGLSQEKLLNFHPFTVSATHP